MSLTADRLGTWSLRHRSAAALVAFVLLVGAGLRIATLRFDLDASAAVDTPAARALQDATRAFALNERAYLLLESPQPDQARLIRLGQDLARRLRAAPCVSRVELGAALPTDEELNRLLAQTGVLYGTRAELEERLDPAGLEAQLLQQAERLSLLGLGEVEGWVERDPLELNRAFARRLSDLRGVQRFAPDSTYALSADRRALLLTVVTSRGPSELGFAREVVRTLSEASREALAARGAEGLQISATGGHLFAEESERTIRSDLTRGIALCSILAVFLLAWGLRLNPFATVLLLLPTAWGVICGLGLFGLLRGELAVLSLGCASVLLGLGVDFTIHLGTATRAARAQGLAP
ncbi:MAG: MMPL family transporter, partial [Planctomycetes bacterium]|nr:MMPL family transporter [Planctomycetota bacterium]